ncbi:MULTISPECIES: DUF86 domain-containing protein [unclassified Coleofasciculus]|uniref:HepT-like ribonuclease domain-containing protein n=1 Tax=unclassified Coleofasciculus TaxID=2692782 RepID=UPI001880D448|nr:MULTISPECIES: DUF86 domain-containing protein [unclassified Coleofasciculus]MBE9130247.1 DUF86 domain-containing protein [Coleofasciculus sp. LEGE 07081]MBE9152058.1 DUF86 domain-containing protein [Coleofasciculus sp. LEGE 07092]
MTKRDLLDFLEDILEAIDEIFSFIRGVSFEEFANNREKVLAVVKLLEIIGEATKKIPSELRAKYPDIPWSAVAGMRDILVHEYWQVDVEVVWETVIDSLPLLARVISEMIQDNRVEGR